jgi:hypothetical protein
MYNQDANLLLNRAIREDRGEVLCNLKDYQGKNTPHMPKRDEVDFIYGGPPWCVTLPLQNHFMY